MGIKLGLITYLILINLNLLNNNPFSIKKWTLRFNKIVKKSEIYLYKLPKSSKNYLRND